MKNKTLIKIFIIGLSTFIFLTGFNLYNQNAEREANFAETGYLETNSERSAREQTEYEAKVKIEICIEENNIALEPIVLVYNNIVDRNNKFVAYYDFLFRHQTNPQNNTPQLDKLVRDIENTFPTGEYYLPNPRLSPVKYTYKGKPLKSTWISRLYEPLFDTDDYYELGITSSDLYIFYYWRIQDLSEALDESVHGWKVWALGFDDYSRQWGEYFKIALRTRNSNKIYYEQALANYLSLPSVDSWCDSYFE